MRYIVGRSPGMLSRPFLRNQDRSPPIFTDDGDSPALGYSYRFAKGHNESVLFINK